MARNQTVTAPLHNLLALNRLKKECYYEPIRVDFSPIQKPNQQFEKIVPIFNNDRNFYTPSFIIPREKIPLQKNLTVEKNKFEARIMHSGKQASQQTPRYQPTDSKYCQLCKYCFDNYWQHVNGKHHINMIKKSKFNKDIHALCSSFQPQLNNANLQEQKKFNQIKTKKIQKKKPQTKFIYLLDSKLQNKISKISKVKTTEYMSQSEIHKKSEIIS